MIAIGSIPSVSVIIATHNRAHLVVRAINSVLVQSYRDYEIIVVDDHSSDKTAEVLAALAEPRLRTIYRDTNGGNAAARNDGLRAARGGLICFLDSDDELHPTYLEKATRAMAAANDDVGFLWVGARKIVESGGRRSHAGEDLWDPRPTEDSYLCFLSELRVGLGYGVMVRAKCFREAGLFDERLRAAVDTDFFLRVAKQFSFTVIPEVLVTCYDHSGEMVRKSVGPKADAYEIILPKHQEALDHNAELATKWYLKASVYNYRAGRRDRARYYALNVLRRRPGAFKVWATAISFELMRSRATELHRLASRIRRRMTGLRLHKTVWSH